MSTIDAKNINPRAIMCLNCIKEALIKSLRRHAAVCTAPVLFLLYQL
jgi:hypothetical protein